MPVREHEPVAVGPVRRRGVVVHDPREQHVRERRQRHRRARVPAVRLLHRVHGQAADDVDASGLDVADRHRRSLHRDFAGPPTAHNAAAAKDRRRFSYSDSGWPCLVAAGDLGVAATTLHDHDDTSTRRRDQQHADENPAVGQARSPRARSRGRSSRLARRSWFGSASSSAPFSSPPLHSLHMKRR